MPRLTITLDKEQDALLEEKTGADGEYESKSEAVRNIIQGYERCMKRLTAREERIEELEQEVEQLEEERQKIIKHHDEYTELVKYVEKERDLQEKREKRLSKPIWTRAKYWLLGREID